MSNGEYGRGEYRIKKKSSEERGDGDERSGELSNGEGNGTGLMIEGEWRRGHCYYIRLLEKTRCDAAPE